jgi:hypothetical protein
MAIGGIITAHELPEEGGVRLTLETGGSDGDEARAGIRLEVVEAPESGDEVLEEAPVFLEPEAASALEDKLLSTQTSAATRFGSPCGSRAEGRSHLSLAKSRRRPPSRSAIAAKFCEAVCWWPRDPRPRSGSRHGRGRPARWRLRQAGIEALRSPQSTVAIARIEPSCTGASSQLPPRSPLRRTCPSAIAAINSLPEVCST